MEIYTPVHMDCMCYVSGCNLHGGHNMMLSMVYLGRTLKLMQNGLRATRIGYNTVKMRLCACESFFVNLVKKQNGFGTEIHLQWGFLDCKWIWRFLCRQLFGQVQRCFSNTCACVFNHNFDWICFLRDAFYFRKLPTIFVNSIDVFGLFGNDAFEENMKEHVFGEDGEFSLTEFTNNNLMMFVRPPPLHVAKAKQLKQKKFNNSMLHVHVNLPCLRVFPVWKKDLRVCSDSRRVFWILTC